jgi:hypothetical protein
MIHDEENEKPSVWVINTNSIGELRAREGIAHAINPNYLKKLQQALLNLFNLANECSYVWVSTHPLPCGRLPA